ncbi:ATP-binding cassette domain-containing protein [Halovivax cerinus]|uniref:ATP-binding cassette domain-containing protein n=1 Tax=Halovivax cerinus TaxID=1487865 RepID=A0ABD5NQI1_9EURY|nr:ATP-binding cassette domain-containing protein [Halovivax cerinus]
MTLSLKAIGKRYADGVWGVRDVDLELDTGIHGLLGPNGAGKSTLLRIIATVSEPSEGSFVWNGTDVTDDPVTVRRVLGYLPQDFGVYPDLTAVEFLQYIAALRGVDGETAADRIDDLLAVAGLQDDRDRKLRTFSGGMCRSVGIVQALVNDPELLVVDEPTVGLDPEKRVQVRNLLTEVARDRVVLLSTHIVPDVEATANTVALLSDGELLDHTTPESLIEAAEGNVFEVLVPQSEVDSVRAQYQVSGTVQRTDGVRMRVIADDRPAPDAEPVVPTLEDAYLNRIDREGDRFDDSR